MSEDDLRNYYDNVYYRYKSKSGRALIIKFFKRIETKNIIDYLDVKKGGEFLDIACGTGWMLKRALHLGCNCYGVDFSEKALEEAAKNIRANLYCQDVNLGFPYFDDNYFDYISCLGSLEHFKNQDLVIKEFVRISKKSGRVLILVPNKDYILHKFGYETDTQPVINRYDLDGWKELLEKNGCKIIKVFKENSHLSKLSESSSWLKIFLKLLIYPLVTLIPTRLSYNFIFICVPCKEKI